MVNSALVAGLGVFFGIVLWWSFKNLPREQWQILASIPKVKEGGVWRGQNLTYYGFWNANAYTVAVAIVFLLMASVGVPLEATLLMVACVLLVCMPASRLIARVVEKKRYTFTTGGASFAGIVIAPWVASGMGALLGPGFDVPVLPALAALSIAYAFGEGIGRLACISFGCCYGKPLSRCSPAVRKLFGGRSFVFSGETKKIAYAGGFEGERVMPIQAVTSTLYIATGLIGMLLFLNGCAFMAFIGSMVVTQGWRVVSELFRADYRGEGNLSAYQMMGVGAIVYACALPILFPPQPGLEPDVLAALKSLWNPAVILSLQALWAASFLYTGRSMVTESTLSFHIVRERI